MAIRALFLDFYGTLVHEDDDIIPGLCKKIHASATLPCDIPEISAYWWKAFSDLFKQSWGETFLSQRTLGIHSLAQTIQHFQSNCKANELIQVQFEHWVKPKIFDDTLSFLNDIRSIPTYILSNIDTSDIKEAIAYHHLSVTDIITSEDVRSYKPRPEIFEKALYRSGLQPTEVLYIGDSLMSDVGGAQSIGIPVVWLNRQHKRLPVGVKPNYVCHSLNEVKEIINNLSNVK